MNFRSTHRFLTGIVALAVSVSVQAHPGHGEVSSFVAGFSHPLLGLDHVLAMLAVGVWAAQARSAGRIMWTAPMAFVAAMLLGAMRGLAGLTVPLVEPMIAASVLVFGLLVAARAQKNAAVMPLIAAFALFHGIAHGAEFSAADAAVATWVPGFTLATVLLHAIGIAIGRGLGLRGNALKSRLAGVPVALVGAVLVFQALPA